MVISGRPAWPDRPNDNRPAPFRKIRSLGRVTASVRWRRCDGVGCDHLPLDAIVRTIEIDRLPAAGEAPRRRCGRRGSCCHERRDGPESSMCVWRYVNRLRSETVFLIVAGLFGLGCAVVTPPFQSPDEPTHLYRCYQLSEGTIVGVRRTATGGYAYGGDVPDSLKAACEPFRRLENHPEARVQIGTITGEFARPLRPGDRSFASFPNSALYSPVPYVPAVAGVWVGRQLRLPPVALMYLARLGTLAGFLPVGWLAVRVTPILKWPAVMLLCSPLVLFLAGSVSADPLTIGLAFLATALVLRQAVGPPVAGRGMAIAMVAVMVAVALCKSLYCPIAAMAVVARGRWLTGAIALGAAVGAAAMWSGVTHPMRVHQLGDDPARQMAWVTHHPVAFAATVGRSARDQWSNLAFGSIGILGWLDTPMSPRVIAAYLLAVVALAVGCGEPVRLGPRPRLIAVPVIAATVGLIALGTYLVWDRIGAEQIDGIQGRYFLPLSLLGCAVIRRRSRVAVRPAWVMAAVACGGSYTLWTVVRRYYAG
jgi:uncharacterized membrane protein